MSLYHEAAAVLTGSGGSPNAHAGGSFKSRVFGNKDLKSPPAQVYALALESCKWSTVLKEVVENSGLLVAERKLTPALAILLTHDLLVSKSGNGKIALPQSHGLRQSIERHKARLSSEFTRARLRRKCATLADLRTQIEHEYRLSSGITIHPRWIRVNTLRSTVDEQLETTFKGWEILPGVKELLGSCSSPDEGGTQKKICLDAHVPNLIAVSPLSGVDFTRTGAYKEGKIILQDKASCFPAYLLDPHPDPEAGDVIDACSAPGNKTTHVAAILAEKDSSLLKLVGRGNNKGEKKGGGEGGRSISRIFAFEKDKFRAKTLERMVGIAGSDGFTVVHPGVDFLKVDPNAEEYSRVGALLLDPSCSGSGIVGRDIAPELHLPALPGGTSSSSSSSPSDGGGEGKGNKNKRKRDTADGDGNRKKPALSQQQQQQQQPMEMIDDDGKSTMATSTQDLQARISALASFQLTLLLHAFTFPAAERVTYSTCSIYAGENEHVVIQALNSDVARRRGWKILRRQDQVSGMREWDVRGSVEACEGFEGYAGEQAREVAEACVRAYNVDDGRGVMGFFVAGFVRDGGASKEGEDDEGPFVRDEMGRIVRDENGVPTLKSNGEKAFDLDEMMADNDDESSVEYYVGEGGGDDGPFVRDEEGRIVRDAQGMPMLKEGSVLKKVGDDKGDEEEKRKSKKKKKNKKKKGKGKTEGDEDEFEAEGGDDEWDGFGD